MKFLTAVILVYLVGVFNGAGLNTEYASEDKSIRVILLEDFTFYYQDPNGYSDGKWEMKSNNLYMLNTVYDNGRDIRMVSAGYFPFENVELVVIDSSKVILKLAKHVDLFAQDSISDKMKKRMEK